MKTINEIKDFVLKNVSLSQIADGGEYESVAEWLDWASVCDIEAAAEKAGLVIVSATESDRISDEQRRRLGEAAGLCASAGKGK